MSDPIHSHIVVHISGEDGDSVAMVGRIRAALRDGGVSAEEIDEFTFEALAGDYDTLLRAAARWVSVT